MFESWQQELIEGAPVARLGTIAPDGHPDLVPVCFAYVDTRFFISIDEKPKSGRPLARLRNIARDQRATLLFDHYDDDWRQLAWVRVHGTATTAPRGEAWPSALAALRRRYRQYGPMRLEELPLIVVEPARVVSWRWPPDED